MKKILRSGICKQGFATALGLCVLLLTGASQAVPLTWDADTDTTGAQDGSGTWTTGAGGWWTTTGSSNANWVAKDTATFGAGVDGTYGVTVGGNITTSNGTYTALAGGLVFKNSGYTLSASSAQTITVGSGTVGAYIDVASGKTATVSNNVTVANGATGSSGILYLLGGGTLQIAAGGTVTNATTYLVEVGDASTLWVNDGTVSLGGSLCLGKRLTSDQAAGSGNLIVDSGTLIVGGTGNLALGRVTGDSCSATLNNGTITVVGGYLNYGGLNNQSGNGTFHLNGGTLTVKGVSETVGTPNSTFNFNGGTLKAAAAATTTFMQGIDTVNVRNNGAIIDSNGENITISQKLLHSTIGGDNATDGGLTKIGAGTLTLTTNNTYTGTTTINAGTLLVNNTTGSGTGSGSVVVTNSTLGGIGTLSGTVTVYHGGTLAPGTNSVAGSILTCAGGLTLAAGVTNAFDCTASVCDSVAVGGALTLQGANTVVLTMSGETVSKESRFTLFTFEILTGEEHLASWTVTGLPTWYVPIIRKRGNSLVVVNRLGTMLSFF